MSAVDRLLDMVDDQQTSASLPNAVDTLLDMIDDRSISIGSNDMIDERRRISSGSKSFRPRSPSVGPVPIKKIRRRQGPKKYRRKQVPRRKLRREQEEVEEPEEEAPPSRVNFDAIGRSSMTS